jgi:membrane fusion protein (multidrug efflux system)
MGALAKWSETAEKRTKARLTFKQLVLLCLACVFGLAAAGYGYYWWAVDRFFQSTDDAYVGGE